MTLNDIGDNRRIEMSEVRQTVGVINRRCDVESFVHIITKKDFATNNTNNTNEEKPKTVKDKKEKTIFSFFYALTFVFFGSSNSYDSLLISFPEV